MNRARVVRGWRRAARAGIPLKAGLAVAAAALVIGVLVAVDPKPEESKLSSDAFDRAAGSGQEAGEVEGDGAAGAAGSDAAGAAGGGGAGGAAGAAGGQAGRKSGGSGKGGRQLGEEGGGQDDEGGEGGAGAGACTSFPGCNRAQGVTDTTIKLGFPVVLGAEEALRAVGGPTVNFGDGKAQVNALVDDLNGRGGIVGRKVEPVFVELAAASPDPEGDLRRACASFTDDQRVFAVLSIDLPPDFASCLAGKQTLGMGSFGQPGDDHFLQKEVFPWSQHPSLKGESRLFTTMLPSLERRGFFATGRDGERIKAKAGLVVLDAPSFRRTADRIVKPFLADKGIEKVEFRYTASTMSDLQAQMATAVQRFKSERVTHVLFLPGFGSSFLFMPAAQEAELFVRYGVDSNMVPAFALDQMPPQQLLGSMGIGWMPASDMGDDYPLSSQEQRCIAVMNKGFGHQRRDRAGRPDPIDGRGEELTKVNYCDVMWAFEAGAVKAGRRLNAGSWVAGLQSLGTSWPSVITFQSDFSRGTPDASWKHRLMAYRPGCDCYEYETAEAADVG